ncbi:MULTISPECIES: tripartite tricarboxylate transporter permease [unclassified Halomonas]|uniref:tripartite tricarboxylate transporter permease n=1 Tax=unclassified Halomonas TaxID=2609666 RepID=UPI0007F1434D|nr:MULTISPECIES: tripartite tricarboxylate transporter permease [unclassified Halomonas]SBR45039.1 putative tricarboxylic transport membrane protein [Halomonas sp. HL-93]SNY97741.1 putative tricarboxylic transport membrane protein [Halomonas sp. hl-4]
MEFLSLFDITFFLLAGFGTLVGIIFGAIPGMTATMAVAVCLPLTYALGLHNGLALLLGLYVGGISGGMVPAVLINIPGTPSSITTTFDGYPMAQKGEGEKALRICVIASVFGGLLSAAVLFLFAPLLADFSIKFSYVEKFLIILLALSVIASLSNSMLVGIFSGVIGIWLSLIGDYSTTDGGNGKTRLMFDFMEPYLFEGFSLLPVLIGIFGISTIFLEAEKGVKSEVSGKSVKVSKDSGFSLSIFKGSLTNLTRSSFIGTFVGLLPGVGGSAASVLAYTQEKNLARDSSQMGKGAPQGIIASESANNALTGGALIPLLSLGIPGDSTTAVLIGAFTLQGIQVGPLFIPENTETWYVMMTALVFANIVMFFLMFYAIKHIAKVVLVPKHILFPIIVMMCVVGAYAINYGIMFDVWTLLIFGVVGYLIQKVGLEVAPLIIGFILGSQAEVYFVKSLESAGTFTTFFTKSPIAVVLWLLILASVVFSLMMSRKNRAKHQHNAVG